MTDSDRRSLAGQYGVLGLAALLAIAAAIGFAVLDSSDPGSPCTRGGGCGYDVVSASDAVSIIGRQAAAQGSLTRCVPTGGTVGIAAVKGTGTSQWDCLSTTGVTVTYTINKNGTIKSAVPLA